MGGKTPLTLIIIGFETHPFVRRIRNKQLQTDRVIWWLRECDRSYNIYVHACRILVAVKILTLNTFLKCLEICIQDYMPNICGSHWNIMELIDILELCLWVFIL